MAGHRGVHALISSPAAAINRRRFAMKQNSTERRSFLKKVLAGSAIGASMAIGARPKTAKAATTGRSADRGQETLYQETEAFRKYYDSLR
ncbi:MAG TPA: hypothetical protein DDX99_04645 [Desulfofustis sp.]|jgi:hypothetical protein|nr:hypothetical protein [Desulfofustis sp.]HBH30992.1 hypothetical protein [Desulfofustis sp.]